VKQIKKLITELVFEVTSCCICIALYANSSALATVFITDIADTHSCFMDFLPLFEYILAVSFFCFVNYFVNFV